MVMGRKKLPSKDKRSYSNWYDENKDQVNAGRKDKYANNSEYRDKNLDRSKKNYRAKHGILSDGNSLVVSDGEQFVGIKITKAANLLGVDRQSLLRYLNLGLLPKMDFEGTALKFITLDQLPLVKKFFNTMHKKGTYKGSVQETSAELYEWLDSNWRNRNASEKIINKDK